MVSTADDPAAPESAEAAAGGLGQNFLADPNLLEAIVRDAELEPADVALEIGGGEGALTERIAAAGRARPRGRARRGGCADGWRRWRSALGNVTVVRGDAMRVDLAALEPAPTAVVSNLPYSIATPVLLRTIAELPEVARVDRDGAAGDRRSPAGGARARGPTAPRACSCSSPARWSCFAPWIGRCFKPRPRVDSALLRLRAPRAGGCRRARGSWCAGPSRTGESRWRARWSWPGGPSRERGARGAGRARARRRTCGPRRSPRRTSPALGGAAGGPDDAPGAGEAEPLPVPRAGVATTGCTSSRSLFCPLTLADRIVVSDAERGRGGLPGGRGTEPGDGGAGRAARPRLERSRPSGSRSRSASRWPPGLGGGSADAAAVLRLAGEEVDGDPELAAELGADVPSQLDPAFALVGRRRGGWWRRCRAPGHFGVVLVPPSEGLSTAEVYAEADRLGLGRDPEELDRSPGELRAAAAGGRVAARLPRAPGQRPGGGGDLAAARDRRGARGARRARARR